MDAEERRLAQSEYLVAYRRLDTQRVLAAPIPLASQEITRRQQEFRDVALLVPGLDPGGVGRHPHLHEVDRLRARRVHLRVPDAGARAHPLGEPGVDHTLVALGIPMQQLAVEHPGDDLHVAVRVRGEAGAARDAVVVGDDEQPVAHVSRVEVAAEAEAVAGVEPGDPRVEAVVGPAQVDLRLRDVAVLDQLLAALQLVLPPSVRHSTNRPSSTSALTAVSRSEDRTWWFTSGCRTSSIRTT